MRTIGLRTCLWRREAVAAHLLAHYDAMVEPMRDRGVRLVLIAVHSQDQAYVDRISDGVKHWGFLWHKNRPIREKLRAGLRALREWDPFFAINIGSDDFVSMDSLLMLLREFEDGADFTGWSTAYIAHAQHGVRFWPGYPASGPRGGEPFGPGRGLSRRLLEAVDWDPWNGAPDRNLDGTYWRRVKAVLPDADMRFRPSSHWGPIVDVKDAGSFTPWRQTARYNRVVEPEVAAEVLRSVGLGEYFGR